LDKIAEISINAANKGCHLICEKPLAINHQDLEKLYDAVNKNNVKLMAMLSMRAEPPFIVAREIFQSGVIGEAVLINGRKSYKWGTRPDWFGDKSKYGGTIGWIGIHALDFINFITELDFVSVAAMKSNFSHLRPDSAKTHGDDWIRIVGTKGVIEASTAKNNCVIISDEGEEIITPANTENKIFKNFLLSLINKTEPETPMEIPFMLTNVCLTASDSTDNKIKVNIFGRLQKEIIINK